MNSSEKYIESAQKNVERSGSSENIERALRRPQYDWKDMKNAGYFEGSEKCRMFGGLERNFFISSCKNNYTIRTILRTILPIINLCHRNRGHSKVCHLPWGGGGSSKIVTKSGKEGGVKQI